MLLVLDHLTPTQRRCSSTAARRRLRRRRRAAQLLGQRYRGPCRAHRANPQSPTRAGLFDSDRRLVACGQIVPPKQPRRPLRHRLRRPARPCRAPLPRAAGPALRSRRPQAHLQVGCDNDAAQLALPQARLHWAYRYHHRSPTDLVGLTSSLTLARGSSLSHPPPAAWRKCLGVGGSCMWAFSAYSLS